MKRLFFLALVLASCAHGGKGSDDPCRGRTHFVPGTVASCCGENTVFWNGNACEANTGHCACDCNGIDCGEGFPTINACMDAMASCRTGR